MSDPILPVVHLNGTHVDELIVNRLDLAGALRQAVQAVERFGPNARDYYVVPGLWDKALAQQAARLRALRGILDEVAQEIQTLSDIRDERQARRG